MSTKKPSPTERVSSQSMNDEKMSAPRRHGGVEQNSEKSPQKNGPTSPSRTTPGVTWVQNDFSFSCFGKPTRYMVISVLLWIKFNYLCCNVAETVTKKENRIHSKRKSGTRIWMTLSPTMANRVSLWERCTTMKAPNLTNWALSRVSVVLIRLESSSVCLERE